MYERVGPTHSWDAPQRVTNILLLKLQRHSDHHLRECSFFESMKLVAFQGAVLTDILRHLRRCMEGVPYSSARSS